MRNPAFNSSAFNQNGALVAAETVTAEQLDEIYQRPSAERPLDDRMTIEDSIRKSAAAFGVLLVGAAIGWVTMPAVPWLWIGAGIVGLVLALVNIFKKQPSGALVLAYSAAQGVFLGGISAFYEAMYPGIVMQAVIATLCVVGITLWLFASGRVRASKKATKIFLIALIGYAVFSLVNVVLMLTGAVADPWGLRSGVEIFGIPLGIILGVLAVLLGAYSLVLDFDFIKQGADNGAPRAYGWRGAFGVMLTIIWLYLEILRLIAIARD